MSCREVRANIILSNETHCFLLHSREGFKSLNEVKSGNGKLRNLIFAVTV